MTDTYGEAYGDTYGGGSVLNAPSAIHVLIDWDRDGSFATYGDDVTDRVRRADAPVAVSYGRDQSTALAPTVSGQGSFTLDNTDARFSPRNTASPLAGKLKPGRPVLITREDNGITERLFVGHTDDSPLNPDVDAETVSVGLVDNLADFRGQNLSTQLYRGIRTGEAIGLILDACGWDAELRDLDPGATVMPWWWEDGDAATALEKVVRSEGPPALLTMGADGSIVFRDRHHRILDATSLTAQQTWRATGTGLVMARGFTYDEAWSKLINQGTASIDVRIPQVEQAVWTADATVSVTEGETKLITATASDPFYDAVAPVAGIDFTAAFGSATVELLRTSGGSVTIKISGLAGDAIVSGLQLRAKPVPVGYTVQISVSDSTSIADYGARGFPADLPWCNQYDAEAILATAVATRAQPLPVAQARFVIASDPSKLPLLGLDLSDRVHIIEPRTATATDFYLESISHNLTSVQDHEVTFGLEEAPSEPDNVLRLDSTEFGLDTGVLGAGLDDPNLIIILDSTVAGHRLGEGVLAS